MAGAGYGQRSGRSRGGRLGRLRARPARAAPGGTARAARGARARLHRAGRHLPQRRGGGRAAEPGHPRPPRRRRMARRRGGGAVRPRSRCAADRPVRVVDGGGDLRGAAGPVATRGARHRGGLGRPGDRLAGHVAPAGAQPVAAGVAHPARHRLHEPQGRHRLRPVRPGRPSAVGSPADTARALGGRHRRATRPESRAGRRRALAGLGPALPGGARRWSTRPRGMPTPTRTRRR